MHKKNNSDYNFKEIAMNLAQINSGMNTTKATKGPKIGMSGSGQHN